MSAVAKQDPATEPDTEVTMTPEEEAAEVASRVAEKFSDVDLWDDNDWRLDRPSLHIAMHAKIRKARPKDKSERTTHALTRGSLVRSIVPDTPSVGSDEFNALDDIDQQVVREVTSRIWREVKPYQHSGLAAMARAEGVILVKTEISVDEEPVPAVYVTDDVDLLKQDYRGPLRDGVRKATSKYAESMAEVIRVLPEHADTFKKDVTKDLKAAGDLAKSVLAIEAPDNGDGS